MRSARLRAARTGGDQIGAAQRGDHVATDVSAKNVGEAGTGDRLKIRHRRQNQLLERSKIDTLRRDRAGRANDLAIGAPRPVLEPAGDVDQLVGTRPQLVADIGDDEIEIAVAADDGGKRLPRYRLRRREDHRLDPHHVFPPAHRSGQIGQRAIKIDLRFGTSHGHSP
jgi:hypothetical protein